MSRWRTLHGIPVGLLSPDKAETAWSRVDTALEIISRFDPRRLGRLRSDVGRIFVGPMKHPLFSPPTRVCFLDEGTVLEWATGDIASSLVHEAVHARLRRKGLTAFGADFSEREEELCIDEQIAFAKRLPPDEFTAIDQALLRLQELRRTYPPTQAWPRRND